MRSSLPRLVSLSVMAVAAAALRADDVEILRPLVVNAPAGAASAQPSLISSWTDDNTVIDLNDLARATVGLNFNDAGARGFGQTASLRGLSNTPFFGDTSAPLYLDGIPFGSAFAFPIRIFNNADVEVFRGPQAATLFGRAGDAGVIQIKSAPAGARASGQLYGSLGNYNLRSVGAVAETGRVGQADVAVSINSFQHDGYIRNTQLNQDVDDRDTLAAHVRAHYRPSDATELSLHLFGERTRDGAQSLVPLGGAYHEVQRGKEGESDTDFGAAALGLTHKLADGTLTATTSYSKWELSPYSNRLVVFGGLNFDSALSQSQRTFAEEVRFVADNYSGGAYYSDGRTRGFTDRTFSGFPVERSSYDIGSESIALFGRTTLAAGPVWTLTPGARVERTAKDFLRVEAIPGSSTIRRDDDWSAFLPSIAASRKLDDTSDVTFTLARGFKPGGYSGYTGRADLAGFGPQRTWTLDGAYHFAPKNGSATYAARAYFSRVRGYQIERSFAVPGSFTDEYLVVNAKEAQVLGFELESVQHFGPDVTLTVAASICRAELKDFTDPFTGTSYSGSQAPYAPSGNARVRLDYRPATGVFAGVGATWTGTTYYDEQETAMFAQRSYALIEADLGYRFARGEVRLFGRNLGDKEYYSSITPGVGHATPGAPRTYGGEVSFRW